jgi:hypothetical protein
VAPALSPNPVQASRAGRDSRFGQSRLSTSATPTHCA